MVEEFLLLGNLQYLGSVLVIEGDGLLAQDVLVVGQQELGDLVVSWIDGSDVNNICKGNTGKDNIRPLYFSCGKSNNLPTSGS